MLRLVNVPSRPSGTMIEPYGSLIKLSNRVVEPKERDTKILFWLAEVPYPVRLVTGRHDPFLPAQRLTEALTRLGGPTAATVVDTAGHLVMEEAPHEVLRAVQVAARA